MNATHLASKFGIEIETVGLSRARLANAINTVLGGTIGIADYNGAVAVTAPDGRVWNVVYDGSLVGESGEIVSPILTYADIETVQNIVRAVRKAGARADSSTGIHIHVDGSRFDAKSVLNVVNMVHKHERLIERALGVSAHRLSRYTRAIDPSFVARLDGSRPRTLAELNAAWYGTSSAVQPRRYDQSRYHGLNLNSLFYRGTIEFRYFNGTLHAGEVKAYIQFVLALAEKALAAKSTSRARRAVDSANEKWQFRVFLKSLGLVGDEFSTLRLHLTKNLNGTANRKVAATAAE